MTDDWEGGEHQGIRWRRVGTALLVVALVAGGVYTVRRERSLSIETDGTPIVGVSEAVEVVETAPLQAGDRWYCPSTHPVRVDEDGLYYPVEYPHRGRHIARPDSCFADPARAEEAGYRLAPPPPGSAIAGGIYVVPAVAPTALTCAGLSERAGVVVPCPGVLPSPGEGSSCLSGGCEFAGGVVLEQRSFQVSRDWHQDGEHVVLTAAPVSVGHVIRPGRPLRVDADPALVTCGQGQPIEAEGEYDFRVCPPGPPWIPGMGGFPHESHTAAFWRRGRVVYAASVEGSGPDVEQVLAAVIEGIQYVGQEPAG